jgi:hypothetical protein
MVEGKYPLMTDHIISIGSIGSRNSTTYFFPCKDGIVVRCGCYGGMLDEFEVRVRETHKDNAQYLREYLGAIEYVKSITAGWVNKEHVKG